MLVEDNVRAGMSPEAARRHARLTLGGIDQVKEHYRDRAGIPFVDHVFQDARVGARMLRRNPTFTIVAVLTLGLGIGANTAIFSVVNAVLLRPLPFPAPDRLVLIWATNTKSGDTQDVASYPDVEAWRAQSRSFDGMAAFTSRSAMLAGDGRAELVPALQTMPGFFETLGIQPAMGRTFRAEEQEPGSRVVILSDSGWKRHFGGRDDVLGQTLRVNEEPHTVIGVMPEGVSVLPLEPEQVFTTVPRETNRNHGYLRTVARLKPGVSLEAAQAEMDAITGRIAAEFPKSNEFVGANVMPLVDALVGDARPGLIICLGAVAAVLLVACTNVANLLLSRNVSRQRELALRTALGAGRLRLMQQLLTETLLIAFAGGALGLVLATWTAPVLAALLLDSFPIPRIDGTRTDQSVLAFTLLVSIATALVCGGLHAFAAMSPDVSDGLRESSRTATAAPAGRRIRSVLVVTEIAIALALLAGAGALLKSLLVMRQTAPGFQSANVLTVGFVLPQSKLQNDDGPAGVLRDRAVAHRGAARRAVGRARREPSAQRRLRLAGVPDCRQATASAARLFQRELQHRQPRVFPHADDPRAIRPGVYVGGFDGGARRHRDQRDGGGALLAGRGPAGTTDHDIEGAFDGRRRRRRRTADEPRERRAARDLSELSTTDAGLAAADARRPDRCGPGGARPVDQGGGRVDRSQCPRRADSHARRRAVGIDGCDARLHDPARVVRAAGADARGSRSLRSGVLRGLAADARDGHPPGARRGAT